jgi:hypothetical protein
MDLSLLPLELARWDEAEPGELFIVPIYSDVRPLRGPAGLLDWRLCGDLSAALREEKLTGEVGEKLLLPTRRIPWQAVLVVGSGPSRGFDEKRFIAVCGGALEAARKLRKTRLAIALPGRELGLIEPRRAVVLMREQLPPDEPPPAITLIDSPPALKSMSELLGLAPKAKPRAVTPLAR